MMKSTYKDYQTLLNRFVNRTLSPDEFQNIFLSRFKKEKRELDEPLFSLLNELFGDVDSFSENPELLADPTGFYLDEKELRERANAVLIRLTRE